MSRPRALAVGLFAWMLAAAVPYGQTTAPQPHATGVVIDGSVVDAALNPLPGVAVTLLKLDQALATTTSDTKGQFHFAPVSPGAYKVRAELTNFTTLTRDVTLKASSASITLPLVLDVAAGLTPEQIAQLPAATRQALNFVTFLPGADSATSVKAGPPAPPAIPAVGGVAGGAGGGRGGGRQSTVLGLPQSSITLAAPEFRSGSQSTDGFYPIYSPRWPYPQPGESYQHLPPNRFHTTVEDPALDVRRGRRHGVVHQRAALPVGGPAAAARRGARRGARELLPLRVRRAARTEADRAHDGSRRLSVGAVAQARADRRAREESKRRATSRAAISCCSSTSRARWRRPDKLPLDQDGARHVRRHAAIRTIASRSSPTPARAASRCRRREARHRARIHDAIDSLERRRIHQRRRGADHGVSHGARGAHPRRRQPRDPRDRRRLQRRHRQPARPAAISSSASATRACSSRSSASAPAISRTRRWRCWRIRGTATTRTSTRCRKRAACSFARPTRRSRPSRRT